MNSKSWSCTFTRSVPPLSAWFEWGLADGLGVESAAPANNAAVASIAVPSEASSADKGGFSDMRLLRRLQRHQTPQNAHSSSFLHFGAEECECLPQSLGFAGLGA